MTNEEKQIEEMGDIIFDTIIYGEFDDMGLPSKKTVKQTSEALYNAGYRKASDVAREIFGELEATFNGDGFHYFIAEPIFDKLKKKYESEANK